MRVTIHLNRFYDWEPVPADVQVTDKDIKAGRVRPGAASGYLMRVKKEASTHCACHVTEANIIGVIIHEAMPNQGSRIISRREAVGLLLAQQVMPNHAHPSFMKHGIEVHDDGPDESLFRTLLAPYVTATHDASGEPLISPDVVESMVEKYMEKVTSQAHVDHLHATFNLKPKAVS